MHHECLPIFFVPLAVGTYCTDALALKAFSGLLMMNLAKPGIDLDDRLYRLFTLYYILTVASYINRIITQNNKTEG